MFSLSCFFIRVLCKTTLYPSRKIQWCNFQGTSPWENAAHAKSISWDHISYSHWELRPLQSYKQSWKGKRAKRLKWKCSKFQINPSQHPKVVFLPMHNSLYYHLFDTLSLTQAVSVGWQQGLTKQKKIWVFVAICIYQRIRKLAMTSYRLSQSLKNQLKCKVLTPSCGRKGTFLTASPPSTSWPHLYRSRKTNALKNQHIKNPNIHQCKPI